jgi:hypothetical protein
MEPVQSGPAPLTTSTDQILQDWSSLIMIIIICSIMIIGGLLVFLLIVLKSDKDDVSRQLLGGNIVQIIGTIFFFPTLILLGVYVHIPKDAIVTIIGAFVGYLFGRSGGNGGNGSGTTSTTNGTTNNDPTTHGPITHGPITHGPTTGGAVERAEREETAYRTVRTRDAAN